MIKVIDEQCGNMEGACSVWPIEIIDTLCTRTTDNGSPVAEYSGLCQKLNTGATCAPEDIK